MILYLDCSSGVSGDMLAAALIALVAGEDDPEAALDVVVRPPLAAVGVDPRRVSLRPVTRAGFAALQFVVEEGPGFATMAELTAAVRAAGLPAALTAAVGAIADAMGAAERAVHGGEGEHLHELAGLDTAVDLLSVAALIQHMAPDDIVASPPALGGGSVETAHGLLSVPAPAVVALLRGLPTAGADAAESGSGELTTPTGAALLAQFVTRFGPLPAGAVVAVGKGAGSRDSKERPNLLRAFLIDAAASPGASPGASPSAGAPLAGAGLVLLETNIDDCTAEVLAAAAEVLRAAGALDVWLSPALMKKGRPGTVVHVLAGESDRDRLSALLFRETTTFGIRVIPVGRVLLEERRETVSIEGGNCAVRLGYQDGELVSASPEFEECRLLAAQLGWPLRRVYVAVEAAARRRFGGA